MYDRLKLIFIFVGSFNPIQDGGGGGGKKAPYQFFPCNFYKRRN